MTDMLQPRVVITAMPPRTQAYYDWLLTGLGILQAQGKLELSFEGQPWDKLLRAHPRCMDAVRRISPKLVDFVSPIDYVCLTGKIISGDRVATFAMDIADAPFNYSLGLLETVDLYFKVQCPVSFDPQGFPLTRQLRIPYHPDVFTFQKKIRPAMLGRPLGRGVSFARNLRVLRQWESAAARNSKSIRLFASFGSDKGVTPRTSATPLPAPHNFQSETSLLARWGDRVHHPNLKRMRMVELLRGLGQPDVNARIWRTDNPAVKGPVLSNEEYRELLARSMINLNVCGFRRSMPYRFMDTFLTSGGVATDNLAVRWYQPFVEGVEIFSLGELGYEPADQVDWAAVKQKLESLYQETSRLPEHARQVRALYEQKWAPQVFAGHLVEQGLQALAARG